MLILKIVLFAVIVIAVIAAVGIDFYYALNQKND